jgi:hypothetical protein
MKLININILKKNLIFYIYILNFSYTNILASELKSKFTTSTNTATLSSSASALASASTFSTSTLTKTKTSTLTSTESEIKNKNTLKNKINITQSFFLNKGKKKNLKNNLNSYTNKNKNYNINSNINENMNINMNTNLLNTNFITKSEKNKNLKTNFEINKDKKPIIESKIKNKSEKENENLTGKKTLKQSDKETESESGPGPGSSTGSDLDSESESESETEIKFTEKKILTKGWIKYFKINLGAERNKNLKENKSKSFIINFQYGEQLKLFDKINMNEKQKDGSYKYIRSKFHFWVILLNDSLNILSSRDNEIQKTFDKISLKNLANIPEIREFPKGSGIEDFGNFSEGYCFKLNLNLSPGETYVICSEDSVYIYKYKYK